VSASPELTFSPLGPFDAEEREVIQLVLKALVASAHPSSAAMVTSVAEAVGQLDRLGALLCSYPSLQDEQALGSRRRDLSSLVQMFERVQPSSLEMYLPTRAIVARALFAGEMNFYRLLRFACGEAASSDALRELKPRVDAHLCHCLHTRLAELLFISIATDNSVAREIRSRAVMSLTQVWEDTTYRVVDFFPVLEATWDARRDVPATLGTLMGTAEMFRLVEAGCDEEFVDYLVRPDCTPDEEAAFREFLFGATTEELRSIEEQMRIEGRRAIHKSDVEGAKLRDACVSGEGDPALALFEFFLSRHLQATARRGSGAPGPKRTAEEYVMLHYLEQLDDEELSGRRSRA
jgi:hypothetical protein